MLWAAQGAKAYSSVALYRVLIGHAFPFGKRCRSQFPLLSLSSPSSLFSFLFSLFSFLFLFHITTVCHRRIIIQHTLDISITILLRLSLRVWPITNARDMRNEIATWIEMSLWTWEAITCVIDRTYTIIGYASMFNMNGAFLWFLYI